jgi:cytochrome P450
MTLLLRFDPSDPAVVDDPYPTYAKLRAAGRLARGTLGQFVVTRYRDVAMLLRSPQLSNEFPEAYRRFALGTGPTSEFLARVLLHRDPPRHRALRSMLGDVVQAQLPHLAHRANELASQLIDRALRRGSVFDAVIELANPLPFMVICDLLGVSTRDEAELRPHALALSRAFTVRADSDTRNAVDDAVIFLRRYFSEKLFGSHADTDSPLLSAARDFHLAGAALEEVLDNLVFLLFAGFETTTALISTASALLTRFPHVWEQLRSDPTLVSAFVEEVVRFDAPIQSRARRLVEPLCVDSQMLRPGRIALLLLGSANRDPEIFARADEFDMARRRNPHLGFGLGAHYCLGAQLARIEGAAVFGQLAQRCSAISLDAPTVRDHGSVFRAYASVRLRCG